MVGAYVDRGILTWAHSVCPWNDVSGGFPRRGSAEAYEHWFGGPDPLAVAQLVSEAGGAVWTEGCEFGRDRSTCPDGCAQEGMCAAGGVAAGTPECFPGFGGVQELIGCIDSFGQVSGCRPEVRGLEGGIDPRW